MGDFKEWLSDNLRYFLVGVVVILIIGGSILGLKIYSSKVNGNSDPAVIRKNTEAQTETGKETETKKQTEKETPCALHLAEGGRTYCAGASYRIHCGQHQSVAQRAGATRTADWRQGFLFGGRQCRHRSHERHSALPHRSYPAFSRAGDRAYPAL